MKAILSVAIDPSLEKKFSAERFSDFLSSLVALNINYLSTKDVAHADFIISEKCAAGSGRFLQVIANVLRMDLKDIGPLSLKSENPVTFTTGCAVFGETEVISRVAEGNSKEDILAGVHKALAEKICALAERLGLEEEYAITGGGGLDIGLIKAIEGKLDIHLLVPPYPQLVTALGAAIIAAEKCQPKEG